MPTKSLAGATPFEAWYGHKPDVASLRTFGCVSYVKMVRPHQPKLDDHAAPMIFIGYQPGSKAWRFYDPSTQRVVVSRDAIFNQRTPWDWNKEADAKMEYSGEFTIECAWQEQPTDAAPEGPPSSLHQAGDTPRPHTEFVSPPPNVADYLDDDDDITPRFHAIDNVLGTVSPPGLAPRDLTGELYL